MSTATTFSNPKEMLGYVIVSQMNQMPELVRLFPYERKAVFSYYYQIRNLDAQLISFRGDMFLYGNEGARVEYADAIKEIRTRIKEEWGNVYTKEYDDFVEALFVWAELIASAYPSLGLVPESGENIRAEKEDHIIDQKKIEMGVNENELGDIELEPDVKDIPTTQPVTTKSDKDWKSNKVLYRT